MHCVQQLRAKRRTLRPRGLVGHVNDRAAASLPELIQRHALPPLLPERGQRHPHGDGHGPTDESTPPRKGVQAVQHFEERLLHGVFQERIVHTHTPCQRAAQAAKQTGADRTARPRVGGRLASAPQSRRRSCDPFRVSTGDAGLPVSRERSVVRPARRATWWHAEVRQHLQGEVSHGLGVLHSKYPICRTGATSAPLNDLARGGDEPLLRPVGRNAIPSYNKLPSRSGWARPKKSTRTGTSDSNTSAANVRSIKFNADMVISLSLKVPDRSQEEGGAGS